MFICDGCGGADGDGEFAWISCVGRCIDDFCPSICWYLLFGVITCLIPVTRLFTITTILLINQKNYITEIVNSVKFTP